MKFTHLQLEAAPSAEHPFGDGRHIYHLYLPIDERGQLERPARDASDCRCRFRHVRPGEEEIWGMIRIGTSGELHLDCDKPICAGRTLVADTGKFLPGEMLSLRGRNSHAERFQLCWTRPE